MCIKSHTKSEVYSKSSPMHKLKLSQLWACYFLWKLQTWRHKVMTTPGVILWERVNTTLYYTALGCQFSFLKTWKLLPNSATASQHSNHYANWKQEWEMSCREKIFNSYKCVSCDYEWSKSSCVVKQSMFLRTRMSTSV
jgi:hypothetical protein